MKKILSVVLSCIIIISMFTICVQGLSISEADNLEVQYNELQFSVYKAYSKVKGEANIDVAKSVLKIQVYWKVQ